MPLGHGWRARSRRIRSTDIAVGDRVVVHPGDDDLGHGQRSRRRGLAPQVLVREAAPSAHDCAVPDTIDLEVARG
jgi:hypothetical protein